MVRCPTLKTFLKILATIYGLVFIHSAVNHTPRCITSMPDFMFEDASTFDTGQGKKCRLKLSELKDVELDLLHVDSLEDVKRANPDVAHGGHWKPTECEAWQKVAIIIPYRDRELHLKLLLRRLHPMLQKQKIHYRIFVVEQSGYESFAKGRLYNIGFREALKIFPFDCVILHDVDIVPETDKNIYACDAHARHLSGSLDEMRYHPMYSNIFGGIAVLSKDNYIKVNGFGNRFIGWGNEDDDFSVRTIAAGLLLTRPPLWAGKCKMIRHMKSGRSGDGYEYFLQWRYWLKRDGLNHIDETGAKMTNLMEYPLYTNITVTPGLPFGPPPADVPQESLIWLLWFYDVIPSYLYSG